MINYLIQRDNSFHVQSVRGFKPKDAVAVVPDTYDVTDYPFLYGELQTIDDIQQWVVLVDTVAKGEKINADFKVDEKIRLRKEYIADIDAEMTLIYGTIDRDKAASMYLTWQLWKDDPSFFSTKGFTDESDLPLDSASKISTYAVQKINQCKDYAVYLMTREKQYKDAVALLGE